MGNKKPIVFILSAARSGSTLLKYMLGRHPSIFAPSELHLLPFNTFVDAKKQLDGTLLSQGLFEAIKKLDNGDANKANDQVDCFIKNKTPVFEIYRWIQNRIPGQFLLDKSPSYITSVDILNKAEQLEDSRYIFLKRHPIDVISSLVSNRFDRLFRYLHNQSVRLSKSCPLNPHWITPFVPVPLNSCKTPFNLIEGSYWNWINNILNFLDAIPENRKCTLSYEEIIQDPELEMKKICQFLGLDFNAEMLCPYNGNKLDATETVVDPNFHGYTKIQSSKQFEWKTAPDTWQNKTYSYSTVYYSHKQGYSFPEVAMKQHLLPSQEQFFRRFEQEKDYFIVMTFLRENSGTPFDLKKLQSCVDTMGDCFPELKVYFMQSKNEWVQCTTLDKLERPVETVDLSLLTTQSKIDSEVSLKIKAVEEGIKIEKPLLFRIIVFQLPENKVKIVSVFHHLIIDGMGLINFQRLLWESYETNCAIKPSTYSGFDYAWDLKLLKQTLPLSSQLQLWKERLDFDRMSVQETYRSAENKYRDQVRKQLMIQKKEKMGYCCNELLLALFSVMAWYWETDYPVLAFRQHRRRKPVKVAMQSIIGWLAGEAPLAFDMTQVKTNPIKAIKRAILSVPTDGVSYNWLVEEGLAPNMQSVCPVLFNYVPVSENLWGDHIESPTVTIHQHEDSNREYLLDVIVRDYPDRICIILRYSSKLFTTEKMGLFCRKFEQEIGRYIE